MEFFGDSISGNCYKLQLAAAELGVEYVWHEMDILDGATRTAEFIAMNPNGKVPLMLLPDGRCLPESNAILSYLAEGSELAGADRYARANVLQWLFFEQYSHEPFIATSRFIMKYLGSPADRQADLDARRAGGLKALQLMEDQLAANEYLANDAFSIADIALYAYTHVAHEGGFDLGDYVSVREWIGRIESRPNYIAMRAASGGH
ncbi:MAG: glutathione S-transferase family protein [Gammaproteobacteria bacterium]|nr:glutathione S-transferase family protein [Gammaproteobacteria bacterium]